jgi:hypothetical protein
MIAATHYTAPSHCGCGRGSDHQKSWLVQTSVDGERWQQVAREEDSEQLNDANAIGTFVVAGGSNAASSG